MIALDRRQLLAGLPLAAAASRLPAATRVHQPRATPIG